MKKSIFLLVMVVTTTISYSQNEYLDYKYAFGTHVHFKHDFNSHLQPNSSIVGLTASFLIMDARKNQHEISLERIGFNRSPNAYFNYQNFDISFGYKYHFNFVKKKTARWIPSLGLGSHLFYGNSRTRPFSASFFPSSSNIIGLQHYVQPALTFHASKRVYLNLSFPVNFISNQISFWKIHDPQLQDNRGSRFEVNSGLLQFQAKFGIGIKF